MTKIGTILASMSIIEESTPQPIQISLGEPVRSQQNTPRDRTRHHQETIQDSSNYNIKVVVINTVNENPNVINMKLQLDTEEEQIEIDFDYNLKLDKPEVVANEMCHEMNLDTSAFNDIRDLIQQQGKTNLHFKKKKNGQDNERKRNFGHKLV